MRILSLFILTLSADAFSCSETAEAELNDIHVPKQFVSTFESLRDLRVERDGNFVEVFSGSNPVGELTYKTTRDATGVEVEISGIEVDLKGQGLSKALIAKLLVEVRGDFGQSPSRIKSVLHQDNLDAYRKAIKRGLTPQDALKETPAYRIRSRFGYGQIVIEESGIINHELTLVVQEQP